MERREMIKREIATLDKALEKGDLKSFEKWLVVFNKEENLGSLIFNSAMYLSQGNLGCITFIINQKPLVSFNVQAKQIRSFHLNLKPFHYKSLRSDY